MVRTRRRRHLRHWVNVLDLLGDAWNLHRDAHGFCIEYRNVNRSRRPAAAVRAQRSRDIQRCDADSLNHVKARPTPRSRRPEAQSLRHRLVDSRRGQDPPRPDGGRTAERAARQPERLCGVVLGIWWCVGRPCLADLSGDGLLAFDATE